jgi:protein phosphatase
MTADRTVRSIADGAGPFEIAGISDRGPVRHENQDVWDAKVLSDGASAVLALGDGMGGHNGGFEAAEAAVNAAMTALSAAGADDAAAMLTRAVEEASRAVAVVRSAIGGNPGTTLVLALVSGLHALVANVGDSRAYLIRGTAATQLTEDHSWAAGQVRLGALSPEEARHHPRRNFIERAILGDPVSADIFEVDTIAGDVLLLCSDGLWEPLPDATVAALIASPDPLRVALTRACDAAIAGGGTDNVTIVALRWVAPPSATV